MVKTKNGFLSSSSGTLLFLGVALLLLLLPPTLGKGYECYLYGEKAECDPSYTEPFCAKGWYAEGGTSSPYGCFNAKEEGCGHVDHSVSVYTFVCACDVRKKGSLCNDKDFGEEEFKVWKETGGTTKAAPGGGSSGLALSPLSPLTFFAALPLTLGALLAC